MNSPLFVNSFEFIGFNKEKNPFMLDSLPGVELNTIFGPATKLAYVTGTELLLPGIIGSVSNNSDSNGLPYKPYL